MVVFTDHGDENCINNTSAGTLSTTCNTASLMHHNSSVAMLRRLNSIYTDHTSILLLTSGHSPCSIDNDTHDHEIRAIAGQALPVWRVGGVWHNDNSDIYKNTLTALHEISHCLGAYGSVCPADSDHGDCVMSYNALNGVLNGYWQSNSPSLYCSACRQAIQKRLFSW